MEKLAFAFLIISCLVAVSFHFGSKYGREKAMKDFRGQVASHKAFYEQGQQICRSMRKPIKPQIHVID